MYFRTVVRSLLSRNNDNSLHAHSVLPADAPKLHLDDLFSPTMTHHFYPSDLSSPKRPHTNSPNGNLVTPPPEPLPEYETPTKQHNGLTSQRTGSPTHSNIDSPLASPPLSLDTPTNDLNAWSSAVGKATNGGKSGRVIERLMNDNDRLLREKKLAIVKLEEEVKRGESARSAMETLQVSNQNLSSMHDSDASLLSKRDRKIQELKEDLDSERVRRDKAERDTRETRRERDDTIEKLRRETTDEREQSKRATSQYDVLSRSWKSLEDRYLKQTQTLNADLGSLRTGIDQDKRKLIQLEVITEQLRQEAEKTRKAKEKLASDFQAYKQEQEAGMRDIRESALHNDAANDEAQRQMESVLGQMKYVVNVKRDVRGAT